MLKHRNRLIAAAGTIATAGVMTATAASHPTGLRDRELPDDDYFGHVNKRCLIVGCVFTAPGPITRPERCPAARCRRRRPTRPPQPRLGRTTADSGIGRTLPQAQRGHSRVCQAGIDTQIIATCRVACRSGRWPGC
jgi:hypothetical protein